MGEIYDEQLDGPRWLRPQPGRPSPPIARAPRPAPRPRRQSPKSMMIAVLAGGLVALAVYSGRSRDRPARPTGDLLPQTVALVVLPPNSPFDPPGRVPLFLSEEDAGRLKVDRGAVRISTLPAGVRVQILRSTWRAHYVEVMSGVDIGAKGWLPRGYVTWTVGRRI